VIEHEGGEREKAKRDWEEVPLTQAELEEMKTRYASVVTENITIACQLFPPHQSWSQTRIERDRNAKINQRQDEENGRIATLHDLERFRAKNAPAPSYALTECILGLLRTGRSGRSGLVHDFDIGLDGWIQVRWLCAAVNEEIPGVRMTVARLIDVVYNDQRRRMQMFIDKPERGQHVSLDSFSFIRATSAHAPHVNIDQKLLFSDRQEFDARSHPNEYGGPDNVYYYTDLAGLSQIWSESAICPHHSRYGMTSRRYVYCVPVTIFQDDCPASCYHLYHEQYKGLIDVQITIDSR
jgi:hypothetical protein